MYRKEKNIVNPEDAARLACGSVESIKTSPAGGIADFKTGGNHNTLPGNKTVKKAGGIYTALSGKLYLLILVGLAVAVILMLAGFGLNYSIGTTRNLSLDSLQENNLNPDGLIDAIKNNKISSGLLISYAGLLTIILVPAAGLIYIIGHFTYIKKYNLALAAAGVLFILILSAVIGLLKS
jgi:hypothetical protein